MRNQLNNEQREEKMFFLPIVLTIVLLFLLAGGLSLWDYERRAPYRGFYDKAIADPFGGGIDSLHCFPPSYREALELLQAFAPAWTFEPILLKDTWKRVLYEETKNEDTNLVAYDETEFYEPYKWMVKNNIVYDGDNWYAARPEAVAYYMDPRNFLDLEGIFQFLMLDSGAAISSLEGVKKIFQDIPELLELSPLVYEAGQKAPYLAESLAIRMRQEISQEGGGISPLARGEIRLDDDHETYYNFYNIGAYPDPSTLDGARINGARFARGDFVEKADPAYRAYLLPWTSVQKAIEGGAVYIRNNYATYGQDSLYLQKFDLLSGQYWHQYMQALTAPEEESLRLSRVLLEAGGRDRPLVFKIPVFPDMPEEASPWGMG